uniref:Peroxiredoxin n=1 Tax=Polytomella parva TaxID=51329 RepID=A0A7S0YR55_9CHLO|mmetsp:Transcript_8832/g.16699  ORF Transcript_8832/g.16699 Transcript_8832/m.16699 type:complete len:200 (+) Transcript_8832:62-661(+)|eukprot:CAMPEP_0175062436 /NCGR_PEP_ID=MMETSP0052_2-20121109/14167_1 /TAXON_ID=51329 ORGANISM="Polytomella parva, Strain SAG 63-3" /NCGR_SAMPLE_ID=MMETSP0052_2 /ASSEMBLY_ACC=CAM_ASM_000194 /LENGTH=199 /DNA_ID=CAMNT_0016328457 /DNA_START=49 /DNA_END=648 /DNA_ORIENTATION=-
MSKAKIGAPAPLFKAGAIVNGDISEVNLASYKGKYVVLFFYPLDFTFVCPTEIVAYSERINEFKALDCEVIGVSIDSVFTHLAFSQTPRNKGGLGGCSYPLVADITKQISKDYGVLIEDGPDAGVSLRGLFIISPTGVLRQITVNDLPVGRSVDETLRLVKAFKFTDEHGEVCPANWTPGAKTMKADPVKSQEYFKAVN